MGFPRACTERGINLEKGTEGASDSTKPWNEWTENIILSTKELIWVIRIETTRNF